MNRAELPGLTGLRGLAALAVVCFHYRVPGFAHGWLAVDVFFVLSGYVLSHVYRAGLDRAAFCRSRFARLAPAHLVATGLFCLAAVQFGAATVPQAFGNIVLVRIVNPPTWSLMVEAVDYGIFALLIWPHLGALQPVLLVGGAALGVLGIAATELRLPDCSLTRGLDLYELVRGLGWFAAGVGLYGTGWRPRRSWLFDNRLSLWLGEVSYPLYLIHFLPWALTGATRAWLCLPISLAAAALIHRTVEVPARRWLRSVSFKREIIHACSTKLVRRA